jgi:hypothetical protein
MKAGTLLIALILLCPSFSYAAQIFGSLRKQGGAPAAGVVEINCGGQMYRGNIDANGSYSVFVQRQDKCSLTVNYEKTTSRPVPIFSYSDPTRYDFELLPSGELRRK